MKKYKYKISVIMPIYKVEKYLDMAIKSVIQQTINFKKNIQLILINDGSPDNCGEICLKYKKKYPENIIYVKQKNQGVSVARNSGIKYLKGKYVNFFDSDDRWSKKAFKKVYKTFEKNEDILLVSCRQKYFEARKGYTSLDYKYKNGDKVIDYWKDHDHIQLSVTSSFIKSDLIKDNTFDASIKYSEDAKFLYDYFFSNKNLSKIAILSSAIHHYRRRMSENSAIQQKDLNDSWYFITTEKSYNYVLDKSMEVFKKPMPFAQYYVAYDYQFRVNQNLKELLSKEKILKYLDVTNKIFNKIDDNIFLEQKNSDNLSKNISLLIKYDFKRQEGCKVLKNNLNKKILEKLVKSTNVQINFFDIMNGSLEIEGYFDIIQSEKFQFQYLINGKPYELKTYQRAVRFNNFLDSKVVCPGFKIKLNIDEIKELLFVCKLDKNEYVLPIVCNQFSHLAHENKTYYKYKKNVVYINDKKIIFSKESSLKKEFALLLSLFKNRRLKIFLLRFLYWISKPIVPKKDIWIVSDRYEIAGDNGQVLFEYLCSKKDHNKKIYFVISKNAKMVKELKKIGPVIYYQTLKYKILFLNSKYIISSHSEKYTTNIVGSSLNYFKDLYKFKYVFLQHGIINNDLSKWLNRFNKNISLFITSTKKEYDSIVNGDYFYDNKVVKLTGLPRYDKLKLPQKLINQILILPTWRSNLTGDIKIGTQTRQYNEKFKESDYFKFYNNLINDERLISILKKYNYKLKFSVHPSHFVQIVDYKQNEMVEIERSLNYSEEFKKSKMLITDYSSVAFDFAYLEKPIIYSHFDYDDFFKNQFYERGYFDYKEDGFGEIANDYDSLINMLIQYIENDCKIEEKYIERINQFFKFNDNKNCKRVYDEIIKLGENNEKN